MEGISGGPSCSRGTKKRKARAHLDEARGPHRDRRGCEARWVMAHGRADEGELVPALGSGWGAAQLSDK